MAFLRPLWIALIALAILFFVPVGVSAETAPTITLFVGGDSHFGARDMSQINRSIVQQLNDLPGTDYPPSMGGRVENVRGLLFMGDMTDNSLEEDWLEFVKVFGRNGKDGLLQFPVYEAIGNHDIIGDSRIKDHVRQRHRSLVYSWNWDDVHFVCLDLHPDAENLKWLAKDLARIGRERPLVIFFHYSIAGPYSEFWAEEQKEAFARAIEGFNVLAIFHGHYHRAGRYEWHGHDVFLPGAPRHSSHALLVVRINRDKLAVATWDFDTRTWRETYEKPIRR